jgi:hypothetical protein
LNADKSLGKQYAPWEMQKVEKWSIVKQFPFYISFWPRLLAVFAIIGIYTLAILVFMVGYHPGKQMHWFRRSLIKITG